MTQQVVTTNQDMLQLTNIDKDEDKEKEEDDDEKQFVQNLI